MECDICSSRVDVQRHQRRELCRPCRKFETNRRIPNRCALCGDHTETGERYCHAHAWAGNVPAPTTPELERAGMYRDGFRAGRRSLNGTAA